MDISEKHILYKKKVGMLGSSPVWAIGTTGGLHVLALSKGTTTETLAAASHPAIARHIAKKRNPDIEFTELTKSEDVDPQHFEHLVPKYEELTNRFRKLQGL